MTEKEYYEKYHCREVELTDIDGDIFSGLVHVTMSIAAREEYELPEGFFEFNDGLIIYFSQIRNVKLK